MTTETTAAAAAPAPRTTRWRPIALAVALGMLLELGGFTFRYAEGLSYFSTDPKACANCHIMQRQYDGWQKASHHGVATCADCHLPHSFFTKYLAKASNGWHHSKGFTLQDFEEPIRIKPGNSAILQNYDLLQRGGQALVGLLDAVGAAKARGATPEQLAAALQLQRRAQWRLDFIAAENSMGFHAPQEAARVLGEAIDYARQGQIAALTATEPAAAPPATSPAAPVPAPAARPPASAAPAGIPAATPPSAH